MLNSRIKTRRLLQLPWHNALAILLYFCSPWQYVQTLMAFWFALEPTFSKVQITTYPATLLTPSAFYNDIVLLTFTNILFSLFFQGFFPLYPPACEPNFPSQAKITESPFRHLIILRMSNQPLFKSFECSCYLSGIYFTNFFCSFHHIHYIIIGRS